MKHPARLISVLGVLALHPVVRAAGQSPHFDDRLIELTGPALDGLARGLRVEIALYKEFKAELAKYPTPEEFNSCQGQVTTSEAMMKLVESYPIPDNASAEESQKIMAKLQDAMQGLKKKMCPLDPSEWTNERKAERLNQIVQKAAAAAGPVRAAPSPGPWWSGEAVSDEGLSKEAYALAKERVAVYCAYTREHGIPGDDKLVKFPGKGNGVWWIYTPTEQQALEPRCKEIYPLIQQSNAYEPGGTTSRNL